MNGEDHVYVIDIAAGKIEVLAHSSQWNTPKTRTFGSLEEFYKAARLVWDGDSMRGIYDLYSPRADGPKALKPLPGTIDQWERFFDDRQTNIH